MIAAGRGYGRACLAGAQAADDADIIVFMDGDGADDPAAIADMVAALRSGRYDFVIGSRARGERERGSMASHQILAGLVAGALIGLLYGVRYTDMCAYRAIRRDTLLALGMREMTYGWNLEMQMRVARAGLRVLEVPVAYRCRIGGQSKVAGSLRGSLRAGAAHHDDLRARRDGARPGKAETGFPSGRAMNQELRAGPAGRGLVVEHDLFGKPASTFPDHALRPCPLDPGAD